MTPSQKILAISCGIIIIFFPSICTWQQSKILKLEKELVIGKETTIVTVTVHDTIHDSIPYNTIVFKEYNKPKTKTSNDTNSKKNVDFLSIVDSNLYNCFEFTKIFEGIGTANVKTCSKTFIKKPDDLNIQMWFYPLPDSIKTITRTDTLNITKTIIEPQNYYKNIAIGSVLLLIGVVVGQNIN